MRVEVEESPRWFFFVFRLDFSVSSKNSRVRNIIWFISTFSHCLIQKKINLSENCALSLDDKKVEGRKSEKRGVNFYEIYEDEEKIGKVQSYSRKYIKRNLRERKKKIINNIANQNQMNETLLSGWKNRMHVGVVPSHFNVHKQWYSRYLHSEILFSFRFHNSIRSKRQWKRDKNYSLMNLSNSS